MYFYQDLVGLIHLISAIISLITGTIILVTKKGTLNHKRVGYVYVIAMTGVNITSFMIYRLWGGWGLFHYAAVISLVTILAGLSRFSSRFPGTVI